MADAAARAFDVREAEEYAAEVLAEVPVPAGTVLDIGRVHGRGWAIVEANASWGAGLYGCAPEKVLTVLARACVRPEQLTAADHAWVTEEVDLDMDPA